MANERARGLGYKFITDDKYLVDPFSPTDGISYEGDGSPVSYANSGIMAQAPIPAPLKYIPQGGNDNNNDNDDDINPYTGPSVSPWEAVKQAGMFMMNPLGFVGSKAFGAYRSRQKEKADFAADQAYKAQQEKNFKEMAANPNNPDGSKAAYNYAGRDNAQGTHTSTKTNKEAQENQDKGRGKYFFGGRVNYKVGGRTDAGPNRTTASHSTRGQINESGQQVSGGQNTRDNNGGNDNNNPPVTVVEDQTSIFDTSGLKSKSPEIGFNYTDPKNYASLKGSVYNKNILDNDDINVKGNLSGEIGPVSYDTSFTDQGITGTNLTAGNFNAGIDANKNYNIGYANNYNGIDYGAKYDNNGNLMFSAGVNFKNGGLAGLL